ncbi:hypothetical protein K3175_11215 [Qipengyuania sp. GH1]|uniref:hypothetical protein n=1 Tax=Qipengyuania aestuarii TaxID=2867241 RepID=UPI001C88DC2E|nr:hypothetical protein [Qipengyuania aestuarii]MBX7536225.1 hypothetical protein [Qipengyuania aestuarii]
MAKEKTSLKAGSDKRTIGITRANEHSLAALVEAGGFGSELDAAKFAMAHAIEQGTEVGSADGANTKWNVGTVDSDGGLRALVEAVYGVIAEPYRLIEYLINEGLRLLDSGDVPPNVLKLIPVRGTRAASEVGDDNGTAE